MARRNKRKANPTRYKLFGIFDPEILGGLIGMGIGAMREKSEKVGGKMAAGAALGVAAGYGLRKAME